MLMFLRHKLYRQIIFILRRLIVDSTLSAFIFKNCLLWKTLISGMMPDMMFNLLHFFRNFTTHWTLIESQKRDRHLNLHMTQFIPLENQKAVLRSCAMDSYCKSLPDLSPSAKSGPQTQWMRGSHNLLQASSASLC